MADTNQNNNKGYFDKAIQVTKQLGFPILVAAVLLYMQFTVVGESVQLLKQIDQRLAQIDNKLTLIFVQKTAQSRGEAKQ